MASRRASTPAKHLFTGFRLQQHGKVQRQFTRPMATEAPLSPGATLSQTYIDAHLDSAPTETILKDHVSIPPATPSLRHIDAPPRFQRQKNPFLTTTSCTLYSFPSMEPTDFVQYPSTHLLVPMRKDILHRAVIFEGDATRRGTASTKWRDEVHGSNRKIRPQKGTGHARLGDKKSPMLRGGGVAFGPKPRDFSTKLQKQVYDLAWRIALSYRYKKGELLVLEDVAEISDIPLASRARYVREILRHNRMGHSNGRTLFVTDRVRPGLFETLEDRDAGKEAAAKDLSDVDVKDLLELGRVVVERKALEKLFVHHQSDLGPELRMKRSPLWKVDETENVAEEALV